MAIAEMAKIYLVAHRSEKDRVLKILQQSGAVEISDIHAGNASEQDDWSGLVVSDSAQAELQAPEAALAEVRFALDFLGRHYPAPKSLLDALGGNRTPMTVEEFTAGREEWAAVAQEVSRSLRRVDERLMSLRNEETRLQNLKTQLGPWSGLEVPLEEVRAGSFAHIELGTLPSAEVEACRNRLYAAADGTILTEINTDRKDSYLFLAYPVSDAEAVQAILKEFSFSRYPAPPLRGTPAENLSRVETGLADIAAERRRELDAARSHADSREVLNYYSDYLAMERDKLLAVENFACTGQSFVAEGWVQKSKYQTLEKKLTEQCETVAVVSRPPRDNEQFPVLLQNNRISAPFEFITRLYGTPSPRAIDPTFPMAPFFIMFFGLCLSDAGYGLIIAALAGFVLWKVRMSATARQIFWILFAGGVSTIIFGALLSGWFGGLIPLQPLFFNALENPMRMLIYSLGIGLVQIYFGMGIRFYRNVREGKIWDAIFDQLFWALLIAGLLLLALPGLSGVGKTVSLAAAGGLILTQGRAQSNIVMKFLAGLFSLYNITGVFGDILSYSRLLALGLASSVIAMAVNMLAGLLGGTAVGFVIMVLVMIIGHAFNLIINILGAYVHSSRLQYLEFFNRFYEGGGRAFRPLCLNPRHVDVTGDLR
jgi:V/A-type H+-transporting ATPase subunit I